MGDVGSCGAGCRVGDVEGLLGIGAVAVQEDGEEDLAAAVEAATLPDGLQQGGFEGSLLGGSPVRGFSAVERGCAGLREGHMGGVRKAELEVADAAEGIDGLLQHSETSKIGL